MKVEIVLNKKKKPDLIHIETRKYNRYILIGNLPGYKLSDMKVYKGYENLDKKYKMKRGTKWELAKNLNTRDKFLISKMEEKSKITYKDISVKMKNKENKDYQKRVKELIERVEKGENSPEVYQQLLEKIGQIKQSAISITKKGNRKEKAVIGFVYALREYYWLIADPKYPFEKDYFLEEIDALYKLIYGELKKPNPALFDRWDIDEKKRILKKMTKVLGTEIMGIFIKRYKIRKLLRLKFEDTKYYKYYACCWTIAFIILITLILVFI